MKNSRFDEESLLKLKNDLSHDSYKQRKNCLEGFCKEVENVSCPEAGTALAFLKLVVAIFNDKAESCREKAVLAASSCVRLWTLLPEEETVFLLLPAVCKKLGCSGDVEPSEEIRLLLVGLLKLCVQTFEDAVSPFVVEVVKILNRCFGDRCPDVIRESCDCVDLFTKTVPEFRLHSDKIIDSVTSVVKHKHYRVRVAAISSLGPVVLFGRNRSVESVCGILGECLLDQNPHVRRAVYKVVSSWFVELRDRYSYFHCMLPLILTGLSDENVECRNETLIWWQKIGFQYLKENEEQLKDKHELLPAKLENYPHDVERPNLGCRTLVAKEMGKIIPAVLKEFEDWKPEVRVKSSELLEAIVLHAEHNVVPFLDTVLPILCRVCSKQEATVIANIIRAVEISGYFVTPKVYWSVMISEMKTNCSSGHYVVLASLFKYNPKNEISSQLKEIVSTIVENNFCETRDSSASEYLLRIISKLIDSLEGVPVDDDDLKNLYLSIMYVMAFGNEDIKTEATRMIILTEVIFHPMCERTHGSKILDLLQELASTVPLSLHELNKRCLPSVFERLLDTCDMWESYSLNLNILISLLTKFPDDVFELVFDKLMEILNVVLKPTGDREIIFKTLYAIAAVMNREDHKISEKEYHEKIILGPLKQQLVWKAGRVVEVIRATALSIVLLYLKKNGNISSEFLFDILPLVLSLCEDSYEETRIYSLEILSYIGLYGGRNIDVNLFKQILIVVAGRLDDKRDSVRLKAVQTLKNVLLNAPRLDSFEKTSDFEAIKKALQLLFINVDDSNEKIQDAVLDLFKEPQIVRNVKSVFSEQILSSFVGKCRYKNVSSLLETYLKIE